MNWYYELRRLARPIRRFARTLLSLPKAVIQPSKPVLDFPRWRQERAALESLLGTSACPRIAFVKQDICEDLYCCPLGSDPRAIIESTMLRTGPAALFSRWNAACQIVTTVEDPECSIWKERAIDLKWSPLEFFSSYRDAIPGRDYGQSRYAVDPENVDWSQYDIVIGLDNPVPARITQRFPETVWCYYVREVKAPSYKRSLKTLLSGQDLFLEQSFPLQRPTKEPGGVVGFPYHLQYVGWMHEMFGGSLDSVRQGVFVDHHTAMVTADHEWQQLGEFGPVVAPINDPITAILRGQTLPYRRTIDPDLRTRIMASKYFLITPGKRGVFGTALVEAVAAGCLAIGSPRNVSGAGGFFEARTTANSVAEAIQLMRYLDDHPEDYVRELERQRALVDWLCYTRPMTTLLNRAIAIRAKKKQPGNIKIILSRNRPAVVRV